MSKPYNLIFAEDAYQAALDYGEEDVIKQIYADIDHLLETGLDNINVLGFHVVAMGSYWDESLPQFIVTPAMEPNTLFVQLVEYEEMDVLDEGPLTGYKPLMPRAKQEGE